ncbi:hypothetical protein TWF192_000665 [Orbilia oligospora]|uniref:Transcription factor 25 n=1 Tax=Orbilia oligospora TaxID=2813651 RepID=A0A6G1LWE1_ORBOL|nr:hypothetical protein TWF191_002546 [Orbilia oligospora]KAF3235638.1 hypothetical protein TWF192_000665 [Orbilia oligospora]
MSTRALRKAQQRAEEERLAALAASPLSKDTQNDDEEDGEEEDEEERIPIVSKKPNLFAMLEAELEEAEGEDQDDDENDVLEPPSTTSTSTSTAPSKSKKNKKKKKKNKGKSKAISEDKEEDDNGDKDFDEALQALKSTTISSSTPTSSSSSSPSSLLNTLLHVDPRHLDLENEMRKLFGRSATRENPQDTRPQRTRNLPGSSTPRTLSSRRNPFVQPSENWPRDSSGGLSMDLLSKSSTDSTISFKYSHSRAYQETQRQFLLCVRSMDPDRMISHLSSHPYHISTLLQTSHIALTQSNDHTTSQTLLSRALFSMGRSSHSVFPTSLTSGLARLSFDHFENRELYFSAWKYILSLSRRGLWRTGLEFLKLLLQLDPINDPLCLLLIIDQYALKSRCFDLLLSLSSTPLLTQTWSKSPNIAYSLSLAEFMAGNLEAAKSRLADAIITYPWIITKLHGALSFENTSSTSTTTLPEELWGILPPTKIDGLLAEMYTLRMGDLWNIPEHAQFLLSVLFENPQKFTKIDRKQPGSMDSVYVDVKLRDLARHIFLMDLNESRGLIGFLPAELRNDQGYAWDILPPVGKESEYQKEMQAETGGGGMNAGGIPIEAVGARGLFEAFFRSLLPDFRPPDMPQATAQAQAPAATAATVLEGNQGQQLPRQQQQQQETGTFEVGEDDLRATLVTMVEDGIGFPAEMGLSDRVELAINVGLVPRELRGWFGERFGVVVGDDDNDNDNGQDEVEEGGVEEVGEEQEEEEEEVQERDSRAIDRLVQILGTGDRASLRMRVDRMFEGQGAEMAEVKRRVEERLGLR